MTRRSLLAPIRLGGQPILRAQSDERLVELAGSGSRAAFEAIVLRYRRALLAYSARILGQARAEDAVQQSFVKAYAALGDGETVLNLRAWLYRIVHNSSLNMLRDRGLDHEPLHEGIDGVERPDQAAERRQDLADTLAAIKSLPPRQRDAIVLRALEGQSYEQIAAGLGVSNGAVRQLLARARSTMRAGAVALTPIGLLARLAAPLGDAPLTLAAAGGSGGGGAAATKLCAAAVAAAVAGGALTAAPLKERERAPREARESASLPQGIRSAAPAPARVAVRPARRPAPPGAAAPARSGHRRARAPGRTRPAPGRHEQGSERRFERRRRSPAIRRQAPGALGRPHHPGPLPGAPFDPRARESGIAPRFAGAPPGGDPIGSYRTLAGLQAIQGQYGAPAP